ncbi:MAG: hypothetical protein Q8L29_01625 [archaeon]|nr:hypothetical protein [archaeon]
MISKKIILLLMGFIFLITLVSAVLDDDGDGIPNVGDKCDNSELGFAVDESGCSCSQKTDCIADNNACTDLCSVEGGIAKCNAWNLISCPSTSEEFVAGKAVAGGSEEGAVAGQDTYKLECQRTRTTAPKDKGDCKNEEKDCKKLKPNQGRYEFYECKQDEVTGKFYEICKELSFIKKDKTTDCSKENPDGLFYYADERYDDGIKCEKGVFNLKCKNGVYDASKSKCPVGYKTSPNNPRPCVEDLANLLEPTSKNPSRYVEECKQDDVYIAKANKKCKEDSCPNGFVFTHCEKTPGNNMYAPFCVSTNPKYTYYGSKCEGNDIETNREPVNDCEFIADIKVNFYGYEDEGDIVEYKDYRMIASVRKTSQDTASVLIAQGSSPSYSILFDSGENKIKTLKDGKIVKLLDIYQGRAAEWRVALCFLKEEDKKCVDNDLDNFFALAPNAPADTDCGIKIDCNDNNPAVYPGIEKPCGALVASKGVELTGSDVCKKSVSDICDKTCTLKADATKDGASCTIEGAEGITNGFCLNGECTQRICDNVYGADFLKCGTGLVAGGQFDCCAKNSLCDDPASKGKPVCAVENKEKVKTPMGSPFNYLASSNCDDDKKLCPEVIRKPKETDESYNKRVASVVKNNFKTICCPATQSCVDSGGSQDFALGYMQCAKPQCDAGEESCPISYVEPFNEQNKPNEKFCCPKALGGCFKLSNYPLNNNGKVVTFPFVFYDCAPGNGVEIKNNVITQNPVSEECGKDYSKISGNDIFSWGSICCKDGLQVGFNQPNGYPVCKLIDKSLPTSTKTKKEVLTPVLNQKVQTTTAPPTQTPPELPAVEQIKNLPATKITPAPTDAPNIRAKFIQPDDAAFMLRDENTQKLDGVIYTFESFADVKPEEVAFDPSYFALDNPSTAKIYVYPKSSLFGLCKQTFIKEYAYTVTRDGLIADFYDEFFMNIFPGSVITEGEFKIKSYEIECPESKLPIPASIDCVGEGKSGPISSADYSTTLDCCEGLTKIEDTVTLGNFKCINCGDGICNEEAGENNDNCPADCTEVIPPSPEHCPRAIKINNPNNIECCTGYTKLAFTYPEINTGICKTSNVYSYVCNLPHIGNICGDGICYGAESKCNCPVDCPA